MVKYKSSTNQLGVEVIGTIFSTSDYTLFKKLKGNRRVHNREIETSYDTTIILYNGSYYVQVEKDWEYGGGTVYDNKSFQDYLSALKYAYGVVFKD